MNATAVIFARGGSKGLPGKNIRDLDGKPLIAWSIEHARAVKRIDRVLVSTDSEVIAEVARKFGAEVPFIRPAELARDDSPEWMAWRHALNYLRESNGSFPDAMVSVPTTAPLRLPEDIEHCLDEFEKPGTDIVLTVSAAHRSPYFNMVKRNSDGTFGLVMPPASPIARRQDTPPVYDIATVAYVARPDFVMTRLGCFSGSVRAVEVPSERALDIDTLLDFHMVECLLKLRKEGL